MEADKPRSNASLSRGWARAADIALRTAHVAAAGIYLGGVLFDVPAARLAPWLHAAVATGVGLAVSEFIYSRHWPYHGRGVMVLAKLALLGGVIIWPSARLWLLVGVMVLGSVGSHMPKRYRHYSFRHGRVVD